eukprot:458457-Alexandrium_andersonii.AAC.1
MSLFTALPALPRFGPGLRAVLDKVIKRTTAVARKPAHPALALSGRPRNRGGGRRRSGVAMKQ